jgi:hypothetical protein
MVTCQICPYPAKCEAREKCITGTIVASQEPLPEPKPQNVITTFGIGKTSKPKAAKGKKK